MTERERFTYWWNKENGWMWGAPEEDMFQAWQAARRWIPFEEELPERGEKVLAVYRSNNTFSRPFIAEWNGNDWLEGYFYRAVSFWQPLPQPPEEGER